MIQPTDIITQVTKAFVAASGKNQAAQAAQVMPAGLPQE